MASIHSGHRTDNSVQAGSELMCPFFRAAPKKWKKHKTCWTYGGNINTLIRHHIRGYHVKQNLKRVPTDVDYINPTFFKELQEWLEGPGRHHDDVAKWSHIFNRISNIRDSSRITLRDPNLTIRNLIMTLESAEEIQQPTDHNPDRNDFGLHKLRRITDSLAQAQSALDDMVGVGDLLRERFGEATLLMQQAYDHIEHRQQQIQQQNHYHHQYNSSDVYQMVGSGAVETTPHHNSQSTQATGSAFWDHPDVANVGVDLDINMSESIPAGEFSNIDNNGGDTFHHGTQEQTYSDLLNGDPNCQNWLDGLNPTTSAIPNESGSQIRVDEDGYDYDDPSRPDLTASTNRTISSSSRIHAAYSSQFVYSRQ